MLTCPHCQGSHDEAMPWRTKAVRCGSCQRTFLCMEGTAETLPRTKSEAEARLKTR